MEGHCGRQHGIGRGTRGRVGRVVRLLRELALGRAIKGSITRLSPQRLKPRVLLFSGSSPIVGGFGNKNADVEALHLGHRIDSIQCTAQYANT